MHESLLSPYLGDFEWLRRELVPDVLEILLLFTVSTYERTDFDGLSTVYESFNRKLTLRVRNRRSPLNKRSPLKLANL